MSDDRGSWPWRAGMRVVETIVGLLEWALGREDVRPPDDDENPTQEGSRHP